MPRGSRRTWIVLAAGWSLAASAPAALAQREGRRPSVYAERGGAQREPNEQRPSSPPERARYGEQGAARPAADPRQTPPTRKTALSFPGLPVQKRPAAPPPRRPAPGFQLSPEDQSVAELVLKKWEQKNAGIKTFTCTFTVWEYNDGLQLNPQAPKDPPTRKGKLNYAAPDKGAYQVDPYPKNDDGSGGGGGEHWICDGKSIYEVRDEKKEIVEMPLPEHLQGQAIADAPLPFVFGSTADKMLQRFWIRVSTRRRNFTQIPLQEGQVLLEALPKTQQDAANFQLVQVIFQEQDMTLYAINQFLPNHTPDSEHRLSYVFDPPSINHPLARLKNLFIKPTNKFGYTHRVEKPPAVEPPAPPPGPTANSKSRGMQMPLRR